MSIARRSVVTREGDGFRGASSVLTCTQQQRGKTVCLSLTGEVDLASVSILSAHLKAAAQLDEDLIVNMSGLRYMDSSGAKAFFDAHDAFEKSGRRIALAAVPPIMRKLLSIVGLDKLVAVFPSVEAALEALSKDR